LSVHAELRAPAFDIGQVVAGRYEILRVLGQGTTGTVYRAREQRGADGAQLDRVVALKAIHGHLHSDRQIFGRFKREVKILRQLSGPHVCKLFECIEEDGLLMISLEYIDGPSLDAYLADGGPLPLSEVGAIMRQICAALSGAHERHIVHRDLKPSNVLISGGAMRGREADDAPRSFLGGLQVRVVDFGLAKLIRGDGTGTALTEQDMIFGTPDYMAPEQVSGEPLDGRCDIYAAGVMLYEMVVGKLPFDTPGPLTTMAAHLNQPVPPPSSAAPERNISAALERVILKALAKEPADRYGSAAELADAIDEACLVASEEQRGAESDTDLGMGDTRLEARPTAISATLASVGDEVEGVVGRGGKVRIVVRDATSSAPPPPRNDEVPPAAMAIGGGDAERWVWTWVAVLAAAAALAVGVWLGVR